MKSIYYTCTFLAALVVLSWTGWQTYLHWDVVTGKSVPAKHFKTSKCPCCDKCDCANPNCKGGENGKCCSKCKADCGCTSCKP